MDQMEPSQDIKKILEEEGRDSRNVISWRVPNPVKEGEEKVAASQKVSTSTGRSSASPGCKSPGGGLIHRKAPGSVGRERTVTNLSERLWGYLFRNVNQAVDELYYLCEAEGSIDHCREAAALISVCERDFIKLTERLQDQSTFNEASKGSLAWEVRKTTTVSTDDGEHPLQGVLERMGIPPESQWKPPPVIKTEGPTQKLKSDQAESPGIESEPSIQKPPSGPPKSPGPLRPSTPDPSSLKGKLKGTRRAKGGGGRYANGHTQSQAPPPVPKSKSAATVSTPVGSDVASFDVSKLSVCVSSPEKSTAVSPSSVIKATKTKEGDDLSTSVVSDHVQASDGRVPLDSLQVIPEPLELPEDDENSIEADAKSKSTVGSKSDPLIQESAIDDRGEILDENENRAAHGDNGAVTLNESVGKEGSMSRSPPLSSEDDYAQATEKIWAEAEAWVEAEAAAEEEAWRELAEHVEEDDEPETDDPCSSPGRPGGWGLRSANSSFSGPLDVEHEEWGVLSGAQLHRKLLDRERMTPSPAEAKRRHEQRQRTAEENRAQLASGLLDKLRAHSDHAKSVRDRQGLKLAQAQEDIRRRLDDADARREAYRRNVVRKANDENSKVDEVIFMNKLTVEDFQITLQMKLDEVEKRINGGRLRRQHYLVGIAARQRTRAREKAMSMSERQLEMSRAAADRWEAVKERLELVHRRRKDRIDEVRRRREAGEKAQKEAKERREAIDLEVACKAAAKERKREEAGQKKRQRPGAANTLSDADENSIVLNTSTANINTSNSNKAEEKEPSVRTHAPASNVVAAVEVISVPKAAKRKARKARTRLRHCAGGEWDEDGIGDKTKTKKGVSDGTRQRMERAAMELGQGGTTGVESALREVYRMLVGERDAASHHGKDREQEQSRDAVLHAARAAGILPALLSLCSPSKLSGESPPPLALPCLLATLQLPDNRDYLLVAGGGAAPLVDCLRWALLSGAAVAKNATPTSTSSSSHSVPGTNNSLRRIPSRQSQNQNQPPPPVSTSRKHQQSHTQQSVTTGTGSSATANGHPSKDKDGAPKLEKFLGAAAANALPACASCLSLLLRHKPRNGGAVAMAQEALLRYVLASGEMTAVASLLAALHPHCEALSSDVPALQAVARLLGLVDAVASFPSTVQERDQRNMKQDADSDTADESVMEAVGGPKRSTCFISSSSRLAQSVVAGLDLAASVTLLAALLMAEPAAGSTMDRAIPFLALPILHATNRLARLSLVAVQEALAAEAVRAQFHLVCDRLLSMLCNRTDGRDSATHAEAEACLAELLELIGFYALLCEKNQDTLHWGPAPTLLMRLCSLPFRYFSEERHKHALFPTLLAVCFRNPRNHQVVAADVSTDLLVQYLEKASAGDGDASSALACRFPQELWGPAIDSLA